MAVYREEGNDPADLQDEKPKEGSREASFGKRPAMSAVEKYRRLRENRKQARRRRLEAERKSPSY
ncbi:hypothetical protein [Gluconobacter morbifer]|uniref:Uncharacterized protein n=1 Tax=Gluconobacter morbifer G707 TaxID=1088869 RepID=G6XFP2_9PROT|nr:hypothetical protein [Gluconobacter morbifer]EHH69000.1 hypothetical protein GMO_03070 [Gluconobacter morbifer G707]